MKELNFVDPYRKSNATRGSGFETDNGIIRVIPSYDKDSKLKYVTISNHNDKKVHVTAKLIPEVIEMLRHYSPSL